MFGIAKSQDAVGPITRTVYDAATSLETLAGKSYVPGLSTSLAGKKIVVTNSTAAPYPTAVTALAGAGATTTVKAVGTPSPNPPSIVAREYKRDVDAFLAGRAGGAKSLQEIIDYNVANPVEGLKYQQGQLIAAAAPDMTGYEADLAAGKASSAALIDELLADGADAIMVPSGDALVGDRRPRGLPGPDRPGRLRHGRGRSQPDRRHVHRHRRQRGQAARRGLRLRAGHERPPGTELHQPEHVALRAGEHVLLPAPLPPGRPAR